MQLFILASPVFLLFAPADFFDDGPSICPSKLLLDIECLGCGLTRGVMHLLHFDFALAWQYNPLSYIVVVLMGMVWFHVLGLYFNKPILPFISRFY